MNETQPNDPRTERRKRQRRWFKLLLAASLLLGAEVGSAVLLAIKPRLFGTRVVRTATDYAEQAARLEEWATADPTDKVFVHDRTLGWTVQPGLSTEADTINLQGVRSERDYPPQPGPELLRVAAFGDSFVYATEVTTPESWSAQLEAAAPIELLNYGVAGYGPDQAYLRFQAEGAALSPHVVLLGIADPNVSRVVNRYRHLLFRDAGELGFKPRFVVEDGALRVIPSPVSSSTAGRDAAADIDAMLARLSEHERFYEPVIYDNPLYDWSAAVRIAASAWVYHRHRFASDAEMIGGRGDGVINPDSEAFTVLVHLARAFAAEVEAQGARPAIVLFPTRESVDRVAAGGRAILAPLADHLRELGLEVLDLTAAFADQPGGSGAWFRPHGHYSPEGNRLVATWLAERLPLLREARGGK